MKSEVGNGWAAIVAAAIADAAMLPVDWAFEITSARRVNGGLMIDARYAQIDVPPAQMIAKLAPHPARSLRRIQILAHERSLVTCEICGRPGRLRGGGEAALARCDEHIFVDDPSGITHFLADYRDGLDMMQFLHGEAKREDDDDKS